MKKVFLAALLMLWLTPILVLAQNAFDGTWKIDMKKAEFPKKPDEYLLQNGMYECKTCARPSRSKLMDRTRQSRDTRPMTAWR